MSKPANPWTKLIALVVSQKSYELCDNAINNYGDTVSCNERGLDVENRCVSCIARAVMKIPGFAKCLDQSQVVADFDRCSNNVRYANGDARCEGPRGHVGLCGAGNVWKTGEREVTAVPAKIATVFRGERLTAPMTSEQLAAFAGMVVGPKTVVDGKSGEETRRIRFFLLLPDRAEIELQKIALSVGSDGRDYYLVTDGDLSRLHRAHVAETREKLADIMMPDKLKVADEVIRFAHGLTHDRMSVAEQKELRRLGEAWRAACGKVERQPPPLQSALDAEALRQLQEKLQALRCRDRVIEAVTFSGSLFSEKPFK